jgi:hypothetical protein
MALHLVQYTVSCTCPATPKEHIMGTLSSFPFHRYHSTYFFRGNWRATKTVRTHTFSTAMTSTYEGSLVMTWSRS